MSSSTAASITTRVYVIVHYEDSFGDRRVLLGREAVLHKSALVDMRAELGNLEAHEATSQRERFRAALNSNKSVIYEDGKVRFRGPWNRGRNFGGVLLIGRASLAGGKAERGESERDAAIRECVEELRLPRQLLVNETAAGLLVEVHKDTTPANGYSRAEVRLYYALDLDKLSGQLPDLAEALSPDVLVREFAQRAADGNDGQEKTELLDEALDSCIARMESGLDDGERATMRSELDVLADEFCRIVNANTTTAKTALVNELLSFQESRTIETQLTALKAFRDFPL